VKTQWEIERHWTKGKTDLVLSAGFKGETLSERKGNPAQKKPKPGGRRKQAGFILEKGGNTNG